jgi:hypothetical protein
MHRRSAIRLQKECAATAQSCSATPRGTVPPGGGQGGLQPTFHDTWYMSLHAPPNDHNCCCRRCRRCRRCHRHIAHIDTAHMIATGRRLTNSPIICSSDVCRTYLFGDTSRVLRQRVNMMIMSAHDRATMIIHLQLGCVNATRSRRLQADNIYFFRSFT